MRRAASVDVHALRLPAAEPKVGGPGISSLDPFPDDVAGRRPPQGNERWPGESRVARAVRWGLEGTGWVVLRPLLDAVALVVALVVALAWPGTPAGADHVLAPFPLVVIALLAGRGFYRRRLVTSALDDVLRIVGAVSMASMATVVLEVYVAREQPNGGLLVHLWIVAVVLLTAARVSTIALQRWARRRGLAGRRTLIVGAGTVGERLARRLLESPSYGLVPVGFLDTDPLDGDRIVPVVGSPGDLEWVARLMRVEHVVLAFSATSDSAFIPLVRRCEELGLGVAMVPRLFDAFNDRTSYEALGGLPVLGLDITDPRGVPFAIKHVIDRAAAAIALLLLAPLLALIALTIKVSSPGPVLFRQRRVGRDGRAFDVLKFRSMAETRRDVETFVLASGVAPGGVEGDDRRTLVGRLLRRTSLDELPQLINVVRGEMSLVGPRPERPEFVERFRDDVERYGDRHRVKAGITGWAQVHGFRGQTSIVDRAELDNYYIEHWSLWLDLKILLLTAVAMLHRVE